MSFKFVIGVAAFLLAFHFGMRYVLTYRFTDTRVQAVLFGVLPVSSKRKGRDCLEPRPSAIYGWLQDQIKSCRRRSHHSRHRRLINTTSFIRSGILQPRRASSLS